MAISLGTLRQQLLPGLEDMIIGKTTRQKAKELRHLGMVMNCRSLEIVGRQLMDANELSSKPINSVPPWYIQPPGSSTMDWSDYSEVSPLLK